MYRLLEAHDLITSPAYIVVKAADEVRDTTTAPNQLWQTGLTHLKVTGWGWCALSSVLDDLSRLVVAWKLCSTMRAEDVMATLELALAASGLDRLSVVHRPPGRSATTARAPSPATWPRVEGQGMAHTQGAPLAIPRRRVGSSAGTRP